MLRQTACVLCLCRFENKKIVFISCRVHPGETPAQFVLDGILELLQRKNDPRVNALLSRFVFKIVSGLQHYMRGSAPLNPRYPCAAQRFQF